MPWAYRKPNAKEISADSEERFSLIYSDFRKFTEDPLTRRTISLQIVWESVVRLTHRSRSTTLDARPGYRRDQ